MSNKSNNNNSHELPFHLRGTHLYLLLDGIAQTGPKEMLTYLQSLYDNQTCVESIFVKGAMSREAAAPLDTCIILTIFQALSRFMTQVERLEVSGDGRFGGLFLPVAAMTIALQQHQQQQQQQQPHSSLKKLTSLRLGNVILTTTAHHEMYALAKSLRQLPALKSIDLVRCRADSERISLEPLVQAISTTPTIEQAMFCETLISSADTGSFLREICTSPSLQKIWWKSMPGMNNDHVVAMAEQLKTNTTLLELTIRSHGLGEAAGKAIADLLLTNKTLQVINLDLDRPEFGLDIAKALHKNTTLTCLDVWAWAGGEDTAATAAAANATENNATNATASCDAITETFTTMLQHNHVLKFLTFQGLDWNNPEVDFYLRLNRAGRRHLLQNFDNKPQWIDVLIKQKEDVAVVYHFLSLSPQVCYGDDVGYSSVILEKNGSEKPPVQHKRKLEPCPASHTKEPLKQFQRLNAA